MAGTFISSTTLTAYVGDSTRLNQAGNNNPTAITAAVESANTEVYDALTQVFTVASVEALTTGTTPQYIQSYAHALSLDVLYSGRGNKPADVEVAAKAARDWLKDVRAGKVNVSALDQQSSSVSGGTGGASVRISSPDSLTFDRSDESSTSRWQSIRDPRI